MNSATIKITQRMLDKCIIDANKSIVEFAFSHLPVTYEEIQNGEKKTIEAIFSDGTASELRLYKRPRGDKLLSIQHLNKKARAGDIVTLSEPDPQLSNYSVVIDIESKGSEEAAA